MVFGVKSSIEYPFLISNVTLFSILFTYIRIDGLSVFPPFFFQNIQNNFEYQIQNTIHQVIQIYHSTLVLIF